MKKQYGYYLNSVLARKVFTQKKVNMKAHYWWVRVKCSYENSVQSVAAKSIDCRGQL
jgi:hypothetical protein